MAPMITDSYLKYNSSEFGNKNQGYKQSTGLEPSGIGNFFTSTKPPLPTSMSYQQSDGILESNKRRYTSEENIFETLKGNNYKLQVDLFDELIARVQANTEISPITIRNLEEFYDSIGSVLVNTISNDVQKNCLRFLQVYFKSVEKLKAKKSQSEMLANNFEEIDVNLNNILLPYLIGASVSNKLQLKQLSIDLIYTYMKITDSLNNLFVKFVKYGIENPDYAISKSFMDPTLCIILTDEFTNKDFFQLVKSLTKLLPNTMFESSAIKCLNKIESIVRSEQFNSYLNRLPQNLKDNYFKCKKIIPAVGSSILPPSSYFDDTSYQQQNSMKFNLIPQFIMQKLSGEDEIQRLQAIRQLEISVLNLPDIKSVYPYYQDFISYMNNFVDDPNYEVRLASLKILCTFIEKLGNHVNQCYKVICSCARQVMSQTHQSKPIKQSLNTMLLLTIENMLNPILILECLLDKIKDRNAKAREEFLNIIMAAVLKYPSDKFDPLRKIFFQVAALLCDIKRNVRHAALECIAVIYSKLKQSDKQIGSLLDQLDNVSEFQHFDNLNIVKDVIMCRVSRNKLPVLNSDMTIDYAIKIPSTIISNGYGNDLDIEWIVSASSSSGSASNLSSARSQASVFNDNTNNSNNANIHRMASLTAENNISISTGSFKQRRPSGTKRLPWEEINENQGTSNQQAPKVMRSREVAPLKAFPLTDELDFVNGTLNAAVNKASSYPASTSYQEKYLKKLQLNVIDPKLNNQKLDTHNDLSDIHDTVKKIQNEKAFSLDNLYNIDDNINSENSIQKRKIANLNFKNGIIPSKPTIPRRNSATRFSNNNNNNNAKDAAFLSNRSNYDLDDEFNNTNQSTTEDFRFGNEIDDSINKKYDTMPNLRTSAKNRKKLEKLFSYGINNNNSNDYDKNEDNNLYLSKLKADKHNETSRYTPSNPESGVFSMSDYDQLDNTNRYSNHANQNGKAKQSNNNNTNSESNNSSPLNNLNNSVPISLDVVSPFNTKPKLLRSTSKSKIDPNSNPTNTNKTTNTNNNNNNKQEYNPLAGVSFKATHSSDVEIVGVKLGNNSNQENNYSNGNNSNPINNLNIKKKASFQGTNELIKQNLNGENDDILDIVGRGYNNPNNYDSYGPDIPINNNGVINYLDNKTKQLNESNYNNQENVPKDEEIDYPLSLSFRSRLRQKTQEKFEEKQRKKVERKQKELESLNNTTPTNSERNISPVPTKNFGLLISGYQNQPNGKPPIYNQFDQPIYMLEDYPDKKTSYINKYDPSELMNDLENEQDESNDNEIPAMDRPKFKPTNATQARLKAKAAAAAASMNPNPQLPTNPKDRDEIPIQPVKSKVKESELIENGVYGNVKEEYVKQPFKNPESAYKEAMALITQEDWEKKCHAMNIIRRLSVYHEDLTVNNIHAIVLVLVPEVKNLRSQVSRFGLLTLGDLFTNLKKYMDVDLDMSVKAVLQKNSESSDFIRSDVEKCLDKMVSNVTTHKGLISLINGGASNRNPAIRRTTAQYIYKCCEIMGPGKILSGIKDVTEKVLITAAQFVVDGPVDIRWYGRKIFHMLMSHDEFDRLLLKYLNETTRKNIKEILDTIRVKGPGEVPTESARNSRKSIRNNTDPISRSAGNNTGLESRSNGFTDSALPPPAHLTSSLPKAQSNVVPIPRLDPQSQEFIRLLCAQLRNQDFRERIEAIEKFQVACETETEIVIANIVQIFDKFNPSLTDSNSKVNYKALNTMFQIAPILGDNLVPVIANVVPLVAQNLASKNSEIQDMASMILDVFIEYLDGGVLIQPFTNIAQHGNVRIRPQIIFKLADLIPHVYSRKQKQVELHVLPTLWSLLNSIKGNTAVLSSTSLNGSVQKLAVNLFDQMGEQLIERASNSSSVSSRNLELLKELINASVK